MRTYVLMRILESASNRYDKGIRILTRGKLEVIYDRLAEHILQGQQVLDIGCGTGALAIRAASKEAYVKGIDINSNMLAIAKSKIPKLPESAKVEFYEMGVAELDGEDECFYDVVMSGLCFSELRDTELDFCLKEIKRILKPGGLLLAADEVKPKSFFKRCLNTFFRFPLIIVSYLFTQTTTHAIDDLPQKVERAGLKIKKQRLNKLENFIELIAEKDA